MTFVPVKISSLTRKAIPGIGGSQKRECQEDYQKAGQQEGVPGEPATSQKAMTPRRMRPASMSAYPWLT